MSYFSELTLGMKGAMDPRVAVLGEGDEGGLAPEGDGLAALVVGGSADGFAASLASTIISTGSRRCTSLPDEDTGAVKTEPAAARATRAVAKSIES